MGLSTIGLKWLFSAGVVLVVMFLLRRYGRSKGNDRYAIPSNAILCTLWTIISIHNFREDKGVVFGCLFGVIAIWYAYDVIRDVIRQYWGRSSG
jgi:hypothetical protein